MGPSSQTREAVDICCSRMEKTRQAVRSGCGLSSQVHVPDTQLSLQCGNARRWGCSGGVTLPLAQALAI